MRKLGTLIVNAASYAVYMVIGVGFVVIDAIDYVQKRGRCDDDE